MLTDPEELKRVWNQGKIPVVLRRNKKGQRLRVRLPFSKANGAWLQNGKKAGPEWSSDHQYWELPKRWFNDFVSRALRKYKALYIIQPYREQEKCAPACLNAEGHVCECSCMGANHGSGNDGSWFEVSEAFACRWGDEFLACRLMKAKED